MKLTSSAIGWRSPTGDRTSARRLAATRLGAQLMRGRYTASTHCRHYSMIQPRVGDLLEVREGDHLFYVVVLTKQILFGGNILFAFHTDGRKRDPASLQPDASGFNVCADLLLPKREDRVTRIHRYTDLAPFWRTEYAKGRNRSLDGATAGEWWIYRLTDLTGPHIARVTQLSPEYRSAMDHVCRSFDLVPPMILSRYTPDKNPCI